jgi:hypothetical protein
MLSLSTEVNHSTVADPLFPNKSIESRILLRRERMMSFVRAQIVLCGGCELTDEQLCRTTVVELLDTFARNGIEFQPKFSPERIVKLTPD